MPLALTHGILNQDETIFSSHCHSQAGSAVRRVQVRDSQQAHDMVSAYTALIPN